MELMQGYTDNKTIVLGYNINPVDLPVPKSADRCVLKRTHADTSAQCTAAGRSLYSRDNRRYEEQRRTLM